MEDKEKIFSDLQILHLKRKYSKYKVNTLDRKKTVIDSEDSSYLLVK